jgi:next-to-BRCA1 protein 1
MTHEFFEIKDPHRVIVHTVFSGEGERETNQPPAAFVSRPSTAESESQPVLHNAVCDMCDSQIYGDRYVREIPKAYILLFTLFQKCLDCPDYDTCERCFV